MSFLFKSKKKVKHFLAIGLISIFSSGACCVGFSDVPHRERNCTRGINFSVLNYQYVTKGKQMASTDIYAEPSDGIREIRTSFTNNQSATVYDSFDKLIDLVMLEIFVSREINRPANLEQFILRDRFMTDKEMDRLASRILEDYDTFEENRDAVGSSVYGSY